MRSTREPSGGEPLLDTVFPRIWTHPPIGSEWRGVGRWKPELTPWSLGRPANPCKDFLLTHPTSKRFVIVSHLTNDVFRDGQGCGRRR